MSNYQITDDLLAKIAETAAAGELPLVVFDLDGTLYSNSPRIIRILHEFAHLHAARLPRLFATVDALPAKAVLYRVDDTLRAAGVDDAALLETAHRFWRERFFTNKYVLYDLPNPGAVEFARLVWEAGAVPVYLTGRDAPRMLVGTVEALQRDGFPVGTARTQMILKEDVELSDADYKASTVAFLERMGRVVGLFDNEPVLCNLFKRAFPAATIVWLKKPHAPNPPPLQAGVLTAGEFVDLLPRHDQPVAMA